MVKMVTSHQSFVDWVNSARPASKVCYHVGALAEDRAKHWVAQAERDRLSTLADTAAKYAAQGRVFLVQKRSAPREFEYWAIKAGRRSHV